MSEIEKRIQNYEAQIEELEALQSIYPDELSIDDHGVVADINNYVSGSCEEIPQPMEYVVTIPDLKGNWKLYVTLPAEYPTSKPEVYVRSESLDRLQQYNFNKCLSNFVVEQEDNEPCIYVLISWVQENVEKCLKAFNHNNNNKKREKPLDKKAPKDAGFARYWIYSHHIYSRIKRKEILDIAKENNITGFCLSGKPGIICGEGDSNECEDWWQRIKAMNWQKILIRFREDEPLKDNNLNDHRKFSTFQEIFFPSLDRHNDMGELHKYLTEHNSQYVFKELFGLEGKPSSI